MCERGHWVSGSEGSASGNYLPFLMSILLILTVLRLSIKAMAALQACQVIGMPECRINLAHIVAYLSEAPKSTRSYEAYKRAEEAARQDMTLPVPLQIRNAPTKLMDDLGYGEGYRYNPQFA